MFKTREGVVPALYGGWSAPAIPACENCMLRPLLYRDKPSRVCHAFPAMSSLPPIPTALVIHVDHDGGSFSRRVTRLDDGDLEITTSQGGFEERTLPAPVALVFAHWESYAIQRLAGSDLQLLPELLKSAAGVSLATFHEEH